MHAQEREREGRIDTDHHLDEINQGNNNNNSCQVISSVSFDHERDLPEMSTQRCTYEADCTAIIEATSETCDAFWSFINRSLIMCAS